MSFRLRRFARQEENYLHNYICQTLNWSILILASLFLTHSLLILQQTVTSVLKFTFHTWEVFQSQQWRAPTQTWSLWEDHSPCNQESATGLGQQAQFPQTTAWSLFKDSGAIFRQNVWKLLPWYILLATWPWCIKRRYGIIGNLFSSTLLCKLT